jgi:hypothetical protein
VETTSNNINFHMTNVSYNGQQSANTVYNGAGFNVAYPATSPMPTITSILLNGVSICSGLEKDRKENLKIFAMKFFDREWNNHHGHNNYNYNHYNNHT